MSESQKQFEEWLNGEFDTVQVNGLQVYASFVVQRMWDAWQASRRSVVVVLPETHNDWLDKQVVQYALDAAGASYE